MKIFFTMVFVMIFEVFGQTTKDHRVGRPVGNRSEKEFHDEVIQGQSAQDRRTYMPGSLQQRKTDSIKNTYCTDDKGSTFKPNETGYKKCVDQANRIK